MKKENELINEIKYVFDNLEDMMSEEGAAENYQNFLELIELLNNKNEIIEKQQKAIEDLEIKTKVVTAYHCDDLPTDVEMIILSKNDFERNISNDYISKDKIRAIIEDLEKHRIMSSDDFTIKVLKGLLKE